MRKLLLVATFVLAMPAVGSAVPCVPNSLAAYVALGSSGCDVAGATFFDFSAASSFFGGTAIDPTAVSVIPGATSTGPRLAFALSATAGAGDVVGIAIGYTGSGVPVRGADLSMVGGAAGGDGVVTVVQDLCLGDVFASDPSNCLGPPPESLIVAADSLGPIGPDSRAFGPSSFFDVFVDITVDGGIGGSASLNGSVVNDFTADAGTQPIPEPSAIVILGGGLLGLWGRRRRQGRDS